MALSFQQIVYLVIALLIIGLTFAALSYTLFWILFQIIRLLNRLPWFANLVTKIQVAIRNFWNKYLPNLTNLWDFFNEVFADPLFYGYALVVVVNRIQSISEYVKQNPQYNFFQILELDMNTDTTFYLFFYVIFTLWMVGKLWKRNQDVREKKAMRKVLEAIANKLNVSENEYKSVTQKGDEQSNEQPNSSSQEKRK